MEIQGDSQKYQIPKQVLSIDSISNIQKKLKEYRNIIQYVVDFVVKSQQNVENHLKAISDMANSFAQNENQKYLTNGHQGMGRHSHNNSPIYSQMINIFRDAILEATQLNPTFSKDSQEFIEQLNKEVDEVQFTQCKLVKESILIYKEHEKEFLSQMKYYKQQSKETQKRIDEYNNCLNDPKLLYNPKEKQIKWERIEKEYNLLSEKENAFFDTLELIQTKKKALGINLQELIGKNQRGLVEIIKLFIFYILKSSSSFIVFFFFYSTYLHEKFERYNKYQWNPEIIPPPHSYCSKSLPFEPQNKYPNILYNQNNLTDQQLVEFSDYAKVYIHDIEKQSIQRQNEVNLSLKFLESLKGYLEGCSKGLKEILTKFDAKVKQNIQVLMGKESSLQMNVLMNNIEIASSQIIKHSKIVQTHYEKIKAHMQNLKDCHQRVFTGMNKALFDHNRIRDEFKIVLIYQSQYQYQSSPNSYHNQNAFQSLQNMNDTNRMSPQSYHQHSYQQKSHPNFYIIKKKIVDSLPALQDCMVFFLNDYEKIFFKELSQVRESMNKLIIQIEKSCKDLVSEMEKEEQSKGNFEGDLSPSSAAYQSNFMNKVNENSIQNFISNLLQSDDIFKILHQDLVPDIESLQVDFTREKFFNHQQISSLQAPSRTNQLNILTRKDTNIFKDDENESFMSFNSQSEEEKTTKNDYIEDFKDQPYSHNQSQISKNYYKNGNSSYPENESLQQSHVIYQDSLQASKQEFKSKATKQELMEHEEFIKKRISWISGEELKHHFSCAFAQNINLQGRIYITNQRLIFQSYFNGNTIFFNETILEIPKSDILCIHKKKNMLSFDNAIQIDVVKGSLLFTQFIYRDDAYNAILNVLQPINMFGQQNSQRDTQRSEDRKLINLQTPNKSQKSLTSIQEEGDNNKLDKQQMQINQRRQNIEYVMKQSDSFKFVLIDTVLKGENITIRDIYQSCLSDLGYTHLPTNKHFENFFYYYIEHGMKCWDISIEKWSPPPPLYFQEQNYPISEDQAKKKEKIQDWIEISQRQVIYDKAIPLSGMPFLPKSCKVSEKQKLIFISPDELIFELEAYSSGAPMTDSFYHVVRNRFIQITPDTVSYKVQMDVRFLKSNWLSGTIESQSQKEGVKSTAEIAKCFQDRITQFLQEKNEKRRLSQAAETNGQDDSDSKSITSQLRKRRKSQDAGQQLNLRQHQILNSIEPLDKYKYDIIDVQFNDPINELSAYEVFKVIFDDTNPYHAFSDLYECLKVQKFNDKNYSATKFLPPLPSFIYNTNNSQENKSKIIQSILEAPQFSEREIKFTHPLPPSSIPFMPKECQVREVIKAYFISDKMLSLNIEAFTSGIPKGDSFSVRVRYLFTQIDPFTVQLQQKSYVHFLQSTFLQGQIESNTIEQQRISGQIIKPFFQEVVQHYISNKQSALNALNSLSRQTSIQKKDNKKSQEIKAALENRKKRILSQIEPIEKYKYKLIDHTFNYQNQPLNLQQCFNFFFSDTTQYNDYRDFYEYLKVGKVGDYDYTSTVFSPPIPTYFQSDTQKHDEDLLSSPDYSEREVKLTHPLPPSNIPFMPKYCQIREVNKVYWVSNDMIIVNLEAFTKGIPKGDSFSVRVRSIFKQIDKENISFTQFSYVHFFESTILQGKIESGTIEQSQLAVKNFVLPAYNEAFQKYMRDISLHQSQSLQQYNYVFGDNRQNQFDSFRIKSIQINDDLIDINSQTDAGSVKQKSPKPNRNQISYRNNTNENIESSTIRTLGNQSEQITQLNQNINQMNDRIKFLIIGFVIIYLSTLLYMIMNK